MATIRTTILQSREDVRMIDVDAVAVVPQWDLEWPLEGWTLEGCTEEHQLLDVEEQVGGWQVQWNEGQCTDGGLMLQEEEVILDNENHPIVQWTQPTNSDKSSSLVDQKLYGFTATNPQGSIEIESSNLFDFSMEDFACVNEDVSYTNIVKLPCEYVSTFTPDHTNSSIPVPSAERNASQYSTSYENTGNVISEVDLVSGDEIDDLMATLLETTDIAMMLGNYDMVPMEENFGIPGMFGTTATSSATSGSYDRLERSEPATPISVGGTIEGEFFEETVIGLEASCQTEDFNLESDDNASSGSSDEDFEFKKSSKKGRKPMKRCRSKKSSNRVAYARLSWADKRERKKEQNKNAATKYRVKKRCIESSMETECEALERRNAELKREVSDKEREVKMMRKLVVDVFRSAAAKNINMKKKK